MQETDICQVKSISIAAFKREAKRHFTGSGKSATKGE